MNFSKAPISLETLRRALTRLEDTILFALIERAQYGHNAVVYQPNFPLFPDSFKNKSLIDHLLFDIESSYAKLGRFLSPEEYPFTDPANLPSCLLQDVSVISDNNNDINIPLHPIQPYLHYETNEERLSGKSCLNSDLLKMYINEMIPWICYGCEDDGKYVAAVSKDIECLRAISCRIHIGKFVAEAKYRANPDTYDQLIRNEDREAIMEFLTDCFVEQQILDRVRRKAINYGRNCNDTEIDMSIELQFSDIVHKQMDKIDLRAAVSLYENIIIPLTKRVEVEYLMEKRDFLSQPKD